MLFMRENSGAIIYSMGFLLGMICMEILLEYAATFQEKFESRGSLPSSITLAQFLACFLLPWSFSSNTVKINFFENRQIFMNYGLITSLVFGSTALATASLAYVAYPVKIVFKSSKLIPTMIVSILFFGTSYNVLDYCAALLLSIGTAIFVYDPAANNETPSYFLSPGVCLLVAAVTCDAFLPNMQKRMLRYVSPEELMVNSNLFGVFFLFLYMIFSGALHDLMRVVVTSNHAAGLCGALIGIGSFLAMAVYCYTNIIREAGPVIAVGVATLRKVVTIMLSYILFPKPVRLVEIAALFIIVGGISLEAWKRSSLR